MEFVSEFEMPLGGNSKKTETNILDVGMPFRPAMFEAVLKKFTPDVPSSISGRPRFVKTVQNFLM